MALVASILKNATQESCPGNQCRSLYSHAAICSARRLWCMFHVVPCSIVFCRTRPPPNSSRLHDLPVRRLCDLREGILLNISCLQLRGSDPQRIGEFGQHVLPRFNSAVSGVARHCRWSEPCFQHAVDSVWPTSGRATHLSMGQILYRPKADSKLHARIGWPRPSTGSHRPPCASHLLCLHGPRSARYSNQRRPLTWLRTRAQRHPHQAAIHGARPALRGSSLGRARRQALKD